MDGDALMTVELRMVLVTECQCQQSFIYVAAAGGCGNDDMVMLMKLVHYGSPVHRSYDQRKYSVLEVMPRQ